MGKRRKKEKRDKKRRGKEKRGKEKKDRSKGIKGGKLSFLFMNIYGEIRKQSKYIYLLKQGKFLSVSY